MRKSLYLPITTLFAASLFMGVQCNKDQFEIEYKYNFVEKINLFPAKKSYKVGDTLWLKYTSQNKRLFDNKTRNYIAVDTVSIVFQVSFNSRYNTPINPAGGFCNYITANGVNAGRNVSDFGTGFLSAFGCNSTNNYDFIVGVVPKQKGIYSLDLLNVQRSVSACLNKISSFPLSTIEYRFNVADGNKDVYLSIPAQSRGESPEGFTEDAIDNKQVYIIKVE